MRVDPFLITESAPGGQTMIASELVPMEVVAVQPAEKELTMTAAGDDRPKPEALMNVVCADENRCNYFSEVAIDILFKRF
jgi:hypothetical protein